MELLENKMVDTKAIRPPVIWPGKWNDEMIVSYLVTIERKRLARIKKWKIKPQTQDMFEMRSSWLTQKWRILKQNGRI